MGLGMEWTTARSSAGKKAGVGSSDIQTTQVSLWPQTPSNGTRITGYQASNSVQVTAALGKSGSLVDAAVGAGANNVDGPSLDTADKSALYNQALKQALAEAKQKAQAIASAPASHGSSTRAGLAFQRSRLLRVSRRP